MVALRGTKEGIVGFFPVTECCKTVISSTALGAYMILLSSFEVATVIFPRDLSSRIQTFRNRTPFRFKDIQQLDKYITILLNTTA